MFIDSHCHLDAYEEFSGEKLDDLFARLTAATDAARAACAGNSAANSVQTAQAVSTTDGIESATQIAQMNCADNAAQIAQAVSTTDCIKSAIHITQAVSTADGIRSAAQTTQMNSAGNSADFPIPVFSGPRSWSSSKSDAPDGNIRMPEAFVHVACSPDSFDRGVELSEKYPFVYAAYGLHPETVERETAEDEARLLQLLKHPKCVACGEFGLDYHYGADLRDQQVKLFERHLKWGLDSGKPLVLHLREADDDALAILRSVDLRNTRIHVHCFTGSPEFAARLLELDAQIFIGFTGIITFRTAQNVRDAAALVPMEKLLLETDSPYMAPVPHRGKTCHSGFITYIAQMLSEVKNVPAEQIYRQCRENTRTVYGI